MYNLGYYYEHIEKNYVLAMKYYILYFEHKKTTNINDVDIENPIIGSYICIKLNVNVPLTHEYYKYYIKCVYGGTDLSEPEVGLAVVVVHDAAAVGHAAGVDDDGGGGVRDAGWIYLCIIGVVCFLMCLSSFFFGLTSLHTVV